AIAAKEIPLVIVLGINSAIAAFYYLRIAFAPLLERPDPSIEPAVLSPFRSRRAAGLIAAVAVVILAVGGFWLLGPIMERTTQAAAYRPPVINDTTPRLGDAD